MGIYAAESFPECLTVSSWRSNEAPRRCEDEQSFCLHDDGQVLAMAMAE
jgi:hypothetical protein